MISYVSGGAVRKTRQPISRRRGSRSGSVPDFRPSDLKGLGRPPYANAPVTSRRSEIKIYGEKKSNKTLAFLPDEPQQETESGPRVSGRPIFGRFCCSRNFGRLDKIPLRRQRGGIRTPTVELIRFRPVSFAHCPPAPLLSN